MFCLTNTGFVQCYFLGSRKVCCTLVFNFSLFSNFCFACLKALQTSGLCSAFPSAPVESVTRFRQNFVLRVLPYKHRVCAVLFLRLPYSLLHAFVVSNLCFVLFASPTSGLCSAFPFGSPQVYTLLVFFVLFSLLLLCVLCPTSSGLCSDFSPAPLKFAHFIFCFVLFSFKFVFCVLSLTNLIFLRFP